MKVTVNLNAGWSHKSNSDHQVCAAMYFCLLSQSCQSLVKLSVTQKLGGSERGREGGREGGSKGGRARRKKNRDNSEYAMKYKSDKELNWEKSVKKTHNSSKKQ